jgi:hypothetical protein
MGLGRGVPGRTHAVDAWCKVVYRGAMAAREKPLRQSVSLPGRVARRVQSLANARRTSASRVIVDLVESGLEARDREKRHYLDLLERLRAAKDPAEQKRLTDELARLTFGE